MCFERQERVFSRNGEEEKCLSRPQGSRWQEYKKSLPPEPLYLSLVYMVLMSRLFAIDDHLLQRPFVSSQSQMISSFSLY